MLTMLTKCFKTLINFLASHRTTVSVVKKLSSDITWFFAGHSPMSGTKSQACLSFFQLVWSLLVSEKYLVLLRKKSLAILGRKSIFNSSQKRFIKFFYDSIFSRWFIVWQFYFVKASKSSFSVVTPSHFCGCSTGNFAISFSFK